MVPGLSGYQTPVAKPENNGGLCPGIDLRRDRKDAKEFISFTHENLSGSNVFGREEDTKFHFRLLSLDGGGVKGVMPATTLTYLEQELQNEVRRWQLAEEDKLSADPDNLTKILKTMKDSVAKDKGAPLQSLSDPDCSVNDLRIADFFDAFAGTSTGALIAVFLTSPDVHGKIRPASELRDIYVEIAGEIFPEPQYNRRQGWMTHPLSTSYAYDARPLETKLDDILGTLRARDSLKPCTIPTLSFDQKLPVVWETGIPDLLPRLDRMGQKQALLQEVCRATSAAPTFFKPGRVRMEQFNGNDKPRKVVHERFVDGGLYANDPILYGYRWPFCNDSEVLQELDFPASFQPRGDKMLILSLGCGRTDPVPLQETPEDWPYYRWGKASVELAMSGTGHAPSYALFHSFKTLKRMPAYLRLQPRLPAGLDEMDKAENMPALQEIADDFLSKERGHRGYTLFHGYDNWKTYLWGNPIWPLTSWLEQSYCGRSSNDPRHYNGQPMLPFIEDNLLNETNGQTLARFAQLLAREWVLRRLNGADFCINQKACDHNTP